MERMEYLMLGLQGACVVEALIHKNWWKALYWTGALVLTVAVVVGMRKGV